MCFLRLLKKYALGIVVVIATFFLLGYFFTDYVYNANSSRFLLELESDEDLSCLLETEFYDSVFEKIDAYNDIHLDKPISYAKIDYDKLLKKAELNFKEDVYEFTFLKKYFPNVIRKNGTINSSDMRVMNYFTLIFKEADLDVSIQKIEVIHYQNPYIIGSISFGSSAVIILLLLLIGSFTQYKKEEIEDNQNIFKSIFHKKYWVSSLEFTKNVRSLCTCSILFTLMMLCKFIVIPSGFGSLGLGLTYLVFATICLIYGPVCGLFIGCCSDTLGYFLTQGGQVFFPGYTLDAMLSGFIYGLCFYKKKITFSNCLLARFFVNILINVGLGCCWWKIVYQLNWDGYITYLTLTSLPKNILYLLPQSILLFVLFKLLSKPLAAFHLIDEKIAQNITLF